MLFYNSELPQRMKVFLAVVLLLSQYTSKSQLLFGVGDTMKNLINVTKGSISMTTKGDNFDKKEEAVMVVTDTVSLVILIHTFNGTSIKSICYKTEISSLETDVTNKFVKFFNNSCVVVNERKWLRYIDDKIYEIELGVTKIKDNPLFNNKPLFKITEKKD